MAGFESFRDKAIGLAQAGMSKAREAGEIARLKFSTASERDNVRKAYEEIGRIYYEACRAQPDAAYAEQCAKIGAAQAKIAANEARLAEIQEERARPEEDADWSCVSEYPPEEPEVSDEAPDVPPEE